MSVKLLTKHNLEFLSLKGFCIGSYESKLAKMPHCWESYVAAHFALIRFLSSVNGPMIRQIFTGSELLMTYFTRKSFFLQYEY